MTVEERLDKIEIALMSLQKSIEDFFSPSTIQDLEIKELARLTALGNKDAIKNYRKNHKRKTAFSVYSMKCGNGSNDIRP